MRKTLKFILGTVASLILFSSMLVLKVRAQDNSLGEEASDIICYESYDIATPGLIQNERLTGNKRLIPIGRSADFTEDFAENVLNYSARLMSAARVQLSASEVALDEAESCGIGTCSSRCELNCNCYCASCSGTQQETKGEEYSFNKESLSVLSSLELAQMPTPEEEEEFYIYLSASPGSVDYGGNVTVQWEIVGIADSCLASGGWSGYKSVTGGSQTITNLTSDTTFRLECRSGTTSKTATASVSVEQCVPECDPGYIKNPVYPIMCQAACEACSSNEACCCDPECIERPCHGDCKSQADAISETIVETMIPQGKEVSTNLGKIQDYYKDRFWPLKLYEEQYGLSLESGSVYSKINQYINLAATPWLANAISGIGPSNVDTVAKEICTKLSSFRKNVYCMSPVERHILAPRNIVGNVTTGIKGYLDQVRERLGPDYRGDMEKCVVQPHEVEAVLEGRASGKWLYKCHELLTERQGIQSFLDGRLRENACYGQAYCLEKYYEDKEEELPYPLPCADDFYCCSF